MTQQALPEPVGTAWYLPRWVGARCQGGCSRFKKPTVTGCCFPRGLKALEVWPCCKCQRSFYSLLVAFFFSFFFSPFPRGIVALCVCCVRDLITLDADALGVELASC